MANIVIVSTHCYLLCEAINSITIDVTNIDNSLLRKEDPSLNFLNKVLSKKGKPAKPRRSARRGQGPTTKELQDYSKKVEATSGYQVTISYMPVSNGPQHNPDAQFVQFTVLGYQRAMMAYREIVQQIREQLPDKVFLNELVDKLLESSDDSKDSD